MLFWIVMIILIACLCIATIVLTVSVAIEEITTTIAETRSIRKRDEAMRQLVLASLSRGKGR